jgi:GDPmannose 4,6-dehydratase
MIYLIFGGSGQDGYYISELCRERGIIPIRVSRSNREYVEEIGDVSDLEAVLKLVKKYKPGIIFHLAANSTTNHEALFENHQTISTGTLNILESVCKVSPHTKVFIAGSGVQFKNKGCPISEKDEFEASSAYAVSRIHSVYAARYYRKLGLKVYVGYLFHHESPLRTSRHVSKKVVEAVRRIQSGSNEKVEIGDLSVEKEWTFAGDIAEGIMKLVHQDSIFEAVIGSGEVHTIGEWVKVCFEEIGKDWKEYVVEKKEFKPEYKRLVSNPETMFSLGWRPKVSFRELAQLMLK